MSDAAPAPVHAPAAPASDATSTSPIIQIRGVGKRYGARVALRDANCDIAPGEAVGLIGANGAGKSTLLRIVATLTRPSRGQIRMFGVDPTQRQRDVRARIGVVSHAPYVYPELSCRENLRFLATMRNLPDIEALVERTLTRVGLQTRMDQRAGGLSRGLLQRLALATALLHAPALLLLDEPDTGLDVQGRDVLASCIREWQARDGSVLFTSHDLHWVLANATRIIALDQGRIVLDQPSAHVAYGEVADIVRAGTEAALLGGAA